MNLTKVISTEFDKLKRLLVKVYRYGKSDIQTPMEVSPYGVDSNPVKDMIALYAQAGENGKTVIIGYINVERLAEPGEARFFSTDASGGLKAYHWLKKDGTQEFNGNTKHLARFEELQTAFNQLKSEFNAHTHMGNLGYPTGPPIVPSSADISGAKIDELKTK